MLEGIAGNDIIVGAYSNSDGICPMLAAHRNGGRTSLISFAQAWDRLAFRGQRKAGARRATERELLILRTHLQASLLEDDAPTTELARARQEHEALVARRAADTRAADSRAADIADISDPAERAAERVADRRERAGRRRGPRPGDRNRAAELGRRGGWSWSRIVRRYDDYERLLARLDDERAAAEAERAEPPVTV